MITVLCVCVCTDTHTHTHMHIQDTFHKEYLIKFTHVQHKRQDINDFNIVLTCVFIKATFYTNTDVHSLRMTNKGRNVSAV
jgi:hypothetical protein